MQRHHTVQRKYLSLWQVDGSNNLLNIYLIPENKIIQKSPNWKGFWRKNYNILDEGENNFYLPEKVTGIIDKKGIEAIRSIKHNLVLQLSEEERSAIAFYVALQYIRTPRFREEEDQFMEKSILYFMRKDVSSPDKYKLNKEEILKHKPKNKKEEDALKKISTMTEEEINKQSFDFLHSDDLKVRLTNAGHSKQILKVDRIAKSLFEFQWIFLFAHKGTSFATSDNPCFTIVKTKMLQGILSPKVRVVFPLRPDLSLLINPSIKSKEEKFIRINKKEVKDINRSILENSYQCLVARDMAHLESLVKNFDYKNHKKSRETVVYESGDYVMFNVE